MRFFKPQGLNLPTLTNPATTKNIAAGMEAIDASGVKMTGRLVVDEVWTKRGETPAKLKASTPPDKPNDPVHLSFAETIGNATAADILQGKTALTDYGKITGTLEMTGGEPSFTLQIKTENPNADADADLIIYYAPGSSEKSHLTLTTALQTITCGDFICLNRPGDENNTTAIRFLGPNGEPWLTSGAAISPKYLVNATAKGWITINIGAVKRDYPNVTQILVKYEAYPV